MVRLRCTCPSFTCHRNCIAASDAGQTEKAPARDRGGFFAVLWGCRVACREINNPDAVNLHSLWN